MNNEQDFLWDFYRDSLSQSLSIPLRDLLSGFTIALIIHSLEGSSIALAIHSLDRSLSTQLIDSSRGKMPLLQRMVQSDWRGLVDLSVVDVGVDFLG